MHMREAHPPHQYLLHPRIQMHQYQHQHKSALISININWHQPASISINQNDNDIGIYGIYAQNLYTGINAQSQKVWRGSIIEHHHIGRAHVGVCEFYSHPGVFCFEMS